MRSISRGASSRPGLLLLLLGLSVSTLAGCNDSGGETGDDDASAPPVTPTQTPAPVGHLQVSPTSLTFDATEVGKSSTQKLTLTNVGQGALTISTIQFLEDAGGAFTLAPTSPDPTAAPLAGEASITLVVQFQPPKTGTLAGNLQIVSDDPKNPALVVALSGTATPNPDGDTDGDGDGYTVNQGDCDDKDGDVHPGATETCNGQDDDCDGKTDEGPGDAPAPEGAPTWYADTDADGYGDNASAIKACTAPGGYVSLAGDCDDGQASIHPGATEACDGKDNDCNGQIDEAGSTPFYADADSDGHGDPGTSILACNLESGYVTSADDCDDDDALTYAGADELCDGLDNDCNSQIDEEAVDAKSYYADQDGDGHGRSEASGGTATLSCTPVTGSVTSSDDCDDLDGKTFPGAPEVCDSRDNDCDGSIDDNAGDASTWYADTDGDGHGGTSATQACVAPQGSVASSDDCNDTASNVYPGAAEVCDGLDNDCDAQIDEEGLSTIYVDADGDGYGDSAQSKQGCAIGPGYAARGGDCADSDAAINPGAAERCDGVDQNCDGQVDEGVQTLYYVDADHDGYGDTQNAQSTLACKSPGDGYSAVGGDCDDRSAAVHPGATEVCNSIDDNCDGGIDTGATDASSWYRDFDADGYGLKSDTTRACIAPSGYVASSTDCNDSDASIHPGALEHCNALDDDCNGQIDEAAVDATTWYLDVDKDGYGGLASTTACIAPSGYVAKGNDCNDSSQAIHPGATEACNGIDDNCDGSVDEGVGKTWYLDRDGDSYGDSSTSIQACTAPTGYVTQGGDCNDLDKAINPGASEKCNGKDDNCDGGIDENATDASTYYADADKDGYGDPKTTQKACSQPSGYVAGSTDCNDASASIYPGATESCDGVDQDCDGQIDDGAVDAKTWYPDADKDGYGSTSGSVKACSQPSGYLAASGDCNDSISSINPGMAELCDGIDQNCDGQIDEGVKGTYYLDRDGDGYGDAAASTQACSSPSSFYVAKSGDCNDFDSAVYPGAQEKCNSKDDNCDGQTDESSATDAKTWYLDGDKDGYGTSSSSTKSCSQPTGYVASATDCNDADAAVNPAATEACNSKDDNCNGQTDENTASDAKTWYQDADSDAYGSPIVSQKACAQPAGYVSSSTDCNDTDPKVNPGATEVCNGKDDNCNSQTDEATAADAKTWYLDGDKDTYGAKNKPQSACTQPAGYVANSTDCDDTDASTYPGAYEKPADSKDNDCDGRADEDGALALLGGGLADHSVVYDPVRQHILLYGGQTYQDINSNAYMLDISAGNKSTWVLMTPSGSGPPPLYQHTAIYDTLKDRMIVFGGRSYYDLTASVWSLSFAASEAGVWTQLSPSGTPPVARAHHAAIFDPVPGAMVVFGGEVPYNLSSEVWSLDLSTTNGAWTLLNAGTSGQNPGARIGHGLVYDSSRDRMVMVGGDGFYARYADAWAFDLALNTWTLLAPSGSTPLVPMANAAASYYGAGKSLLVFGGETYSDMSSTLYTLDFSSSADGAWGTKASTISTPVPTETTGGLVLESDALSVTVLGQTYYSILDSSVSINLQ